MEMKPIIDYKIPPEILMEVVAFESFVRADLKLAQAMEAEEMGDFKRARALQEKAEGDALAAERMIDRLEVKPVWGMAFPPREIVAE